MRFEVVRDPAVLDELSPAWRELWLSTARRPANLHPAFISAWWRSYGGGSGNACELVLVIVRDGQELVGVAPLYALPPHGGALQSRELRLLGNGVMVSCEALLCAPGRHAAVTACVALALWAESGWDLLDLSLAEPAPFADDPRAGKKGAPVSLSDALSQAGFEVQEEAIRGPFRADPTQPFERWLDGRQLPPAILDGPASAQATVCRADEVEAALASLPSMPQVFGESARAFLEAALPPLVADGAAAVWLLTGPRSDAPAPDAPQTAAPNESPSETQLTAPNESPSPSPIALLGVLSDGERRIEILCAGAARDLAVDHLALASLRHAISSGARRLEFAGRDSFLANGRARGIRLRVFRAARTDVSGAQGSTGATQLKTKGKTQDGKESTAAAVDAGPEGAATRRSYDALLRRGQVRLSSLRATVAGAARRPIDRIARLGQATPEAVTQAIARVANLSRLHLYRGELFVRKTNPPSTLSLSLLTHDAYLALPDRESLRARLELTEPYCQKKWERGDLVVLARDEGVPAGILWCARGPVFVPDIGRKVVPLAGECYIHDVFVARDARGRNVAPAMLAFLAAELRSRDFYRAWALIERQNIASTRAFEKAAFASVADVIYARMGIASKLLLRPPDPEAMAFLGIK